MSLSSFNTVCSGGVSVIVPVYKVEAYLRRCVDSLLAQTYGNMEIILVDDGSPDGCPAICDDYAARYSHIRTIHKENGGLSSARLAGFRQAKGEYILFIDSDDYVLPTMVEELVNALEEQEADLAMCSYCTQQAGEIREYKLPYSQPLITKNELAEQYIYPLMGPSRMGLNIPGFLVLRLMKKDRIQEEYFVSENTYYKEDHVFDLEYVTGVSRIAIVNKPMYVYCINGESLSNRYRPGKWKMYENIYHYFQRYLSRNSFVEPAERLVNMVAGGMFASIDNAVLSGSYSAFRGEIAEMSCFAPARTILLQSSHHHLPHSYRLSFLLFKYQLYRILYHLRKLLMHRHS